MADRKYGPWVIHESAEAYRDPWVQVVKDQVTRPDGKAGTYTVVHIKPGVSALPVHANGDVVLTREFHYAVGKETIETVSGGIDDGEQPLSAAKRELLEELGIEADDWLDLGRVDPFTANLLSPTQLFLARSLTQRRATPEGTEVIEPIRMPLTDAVELVMKGDITHAPSCTLILKAAILKASILKAASVDLDDNDRQ